MRANSPRPVKSSVCATPTIGSRMPSEYLMLLR
jgi:hypothetical protein